MASGAGTGTGAPGDDVLVVVVTYNSAHVVEALLDSIPAGAGGVPTEVVVVDNGSTDRTLAVLEGRTDCRVIASTNEGYAGGVVRGIRAAARPFGAVLVLNPDVRLHAGCLPRMLQALAEPGTGIVVPRLYTDDGCLFHSLWREPTLLRATGLTRTGHPLVSLSVNDDRAYDRPRVVDWAQGAVMLISAACLEAVGGWDTSFFLYSEETDLCLRARDRGWLTRYEPSAEAVHIGGGSGQNERTYAMLVINAVRLYRRRHRAPAAWAYFAVALLRELAHAARGVPESRFAALALLRPERRPPELACSRRLMPC